MSEPIPEAIPTSADRRSHRPTKKRALTPLSQQSAQVEALFANPDREIILPSTSNAISKSVAAPPEIVANVQGSSAGAGSGEFHVYKASRRREYERLRVMDEENEREVKDREFKEKQERIRKEEEERLERNRAKRAKLKARKGKAKEGAMEVDGGEARGAEKKMTFGAAKVAMLTGGDVGEDGDSGVAEQLPEQNGEDGGGITFHDDD